jgi:hypothetical protein
MFSLWVLSVPAPLWAQEATPVPPAEVPVAPPEEAPAAPAPPAPADATPPQTPAEVAPGPSPLPESGVVDDAERKGKDTDEGKGKGKGKAQDEPRSGDDDRVGRLSVGARLMMGFEYEREQPAGGQTDPASSGYGFEIRQIRLSVGGDLADLFRVNVSFELADALDPEVGAGYQSPPYLRTATIEYRPSREFRLRVGRFKRPFSHLELESASDLPILRRGLFNGLALEDNQWGDRAIGVMASGRLKAPKLRWYLSLTNPGWSSTIDTQGMDVTARVEWTVIKGLVLGANAAYKNIELGDDTISDFGYGGDVTLALGDAHFLLEANDVALPFETGRPRALGALFMFDYVLPLADSWAFQPVFFAEYADANTDVLQNESLRLVFGANLLGYSSFRVMPQVELVRSIGDTSADNPWLESETLSLIFSLVL